MKKIILSLFLLLLLFLGIKNCGSDTQPQDETPLLPAVSRMVANQDRAISSEAIAAIGSVNTACRLYYVEYSKWPTSLQTLLSSGHIGLSDLDGTYFKTSDYNLTFGELGSNRQGVIRGSARDQKSRKPHTFTWQPARRSYSVTAQ